MIKFENASIVCPNCNKYVHVEHSLEKEFSESFSVHTICPYCYTKLAIKITLSPCETEMTEDNIFVSEKDTGIEIFSENKDKIFMVIEKGDKFSILKNFSKDKNLGNNYFLSAGKTTIPTTEGSVLVDVDDVLYIRE